MADNETVTKVVVTADIKLKGAFDQAARSFNQYFKATDDFWKHQTQRVKDHDDAAKKLARRVSGSGKEEIAGAFGYAAAAVVGFAEGMAEASKHAAEEIGEYAKESVFAVADYEKAYNRLIATGKINREEIEHLEESWRAKLGPSVDKGNEKLMQDLTKLLSLNENLKEYFPTLERITKTTGASFTSVLNMANAAWVAGVKNEDMPEYLKRVGWMFQEIGQQGIAASTKVSQRYKILGIQGAELNKDIATVVTGLTGSVLGNASQVGESLITFMEQVAKGGGDSKMQAFVTDLRTGKMTLIEFLDMLVEKNDPTARAFQRLLENDPVTKGLATAYKERQELIHELHDKQFPDLEKHPMVNSETANAINYLVFELRELNKEVGNLLHIGDAIAFIANALERTNSALRHLPEFTKPENVLKDVAEPSTIGVLSGLAGIMKMILEQARKKQTEPPPGEPKKFAEGGTVDRDTLAVTSETGAPEAIVGADGTIKRMTDKATISTLNAGDSVVPFAGKGGGSGGGGASGSVEMPSGLPRQLTPGFNPDTARYGPSSEGWYYTKGTNYGGHPGDPSRGIPRIVDPGDPFGSNQARVKEEHQGVSLPGTPFGGTESRGPELNQTYLVQLPDGSYTLQRVTDTGPGHKGHGGIDISVGAIVREGQNPRNFGGDVRYRKYTGGPLPENMRIGRNAVTAGGYLDPSSGEGSLPYGSPEYDIPNRYRPEPAQAFRSTMKVKMEVEPPPRHQIERAGRHQSQIDTHRLRRRRQAESAGNIGFA
jgi:hypothetical protein